MQVAQGKIAGSSSAGERQARPKWSMKHGGDDEGNYEQLLHTLVDKLFANKGAFKVDGSLLFEFVPKAVVSNEQLISYETAFAFHEMAEGKIFKPSNQNLVMEEDEPEEENPPAHRFQNAALGYAYPDRAREQRSMEEFMPMI